MAMPKLLHSALGLDSQVARVMLAEKDVSHRSIQASVCRPPRSIRAQLNRLRADADLPVLLRGDDVAVGVVEIAERLDLSGAGRRPHPVDEETTRTVDAWTTLVDAFPEWEIEIGLRRRSGGRTPSDLDRLQAHLRRVEGLIEGLDRQIRGRTFVSGVEWSVADAIWTAMLARLKSLGLDELFDSERRPAVCAYYERLRARPSFKTARVWDRRPSLLELAALCFRTKIDARRLPSLIDASLPHAATTAAASAQHAKGSRQ